jgi:cytoskeletal protein RodZ
LVTLNLIMTLSVGQRLHIARESKGLTLQDVSHQTRIPVARLRDLEDDTYTTFGSLTYARTFLKDYSGLMGVDAHEVLEEMHAPPLGGANSYKYLVQNYGTWTRKRSSSATHVRTPIMAKSGSMGLVAALCGAVLLVGMGVLLGATLVNHKTPAPAPAYAEEVRAASPAPLPETQSIPFTGAAQVPSAPEPTVALTVGGDKTNKTPEQTPPPKKLKLAPGEIPKALPVIEPKSSKAQRQ